MAAAEIEALHRAVSRAPLAVWLFVVAPRSPVVPDAPRAKRGTLAFIERDLQIRGRWNDLPSRAWKKLSVTKAVEKLPGGVRDGEVRCAEQKETIRLRTHCKIFTLEWTCAELHGERQFCEIGRLSQYDAGAAVATLYFKFGA